VLPRCTASCEWTSWQQEPRTTTSECLTEHLIGLVIEHGSALSTRETWKALLDLISTGFACRGFSVLVERDVLVAVDFAGPPTKH
jgi:hypothetical protein